MSEDRDWVKLPRQIKVELLAKRLAKLEQDSNEFAAGVYQAMTHLTKVQREVIDQLTAEVDSLRELVQSKFPEAKAEIVETKEVDTPTDTQYKKFGGIEYEIYNFNIIISKFSRLWRT